MSDVNFKQDVAQTNSENCLPGGELRRLRKLLGFTQKELSHETGLTVRCITNYERGIRPVPMLLANYLKLLNNAWLHSAPATVLRTFNIKTKDVLAEFYDCTKPMVHLVVLYVDRVYQGLLINLRDRFIDQFCSWEEMPASEVLREIESRGFVRIL